MFEYNGFLFGHYDSRGGSFFFLGTDELQARRQHLESVMDQTIENLKEEIVKFGWNTGPESEWWTEILNERDPDKILRKITDEDFIGPAHLLSHREVENNEDFDPKYNDREDEVLFANWSPYRDGDPPAIIEFLLFPRHGEGFVKPDGFEESEFGEDACGTIFCSD